MRLFRNKHVLSRAEAIEKIEDFETYVEAKAVIVDTDTEWYYVLLDNGKYYAICGNRDYTSDDPRDIEEFLNTGYINLNG